MLEKIKAWDKGQWFRAIVLLIVAIIAISVSVVLTIWVLSLRDPSKLKWFQDAISSLGIGGWFVLLLIQYIQIVLAFVPGGPIQVVAGALFGPVGGLVVCFLGTILATSSVYFIVSHYGQKAVRLIVGDKDISKYKFLKNNKRLERLVLILFFVPGTPKDALTYLFALTPLPMSRFLLLSTLARLPAVLTSVLAGEYIINGQWGKVIIIFIILGSISILGIVLHRKLIPSQNEISNTEN